MNSDDCDLDRSSRGGERRARPLVVFPGALGDLVCFEPALAVLATRWGARPRLLCKGDLVPLVEAALGATAEPIEGRVSSWIFSPQPPAEAEVFFRAHATIECFSGAGDADVERNLRRWCEGRGRVHRFRPPQRTHLVDHFLASVEAEAGVRTEPRLGLGNARVNTRPRLIVHPGSGGKHKRFSREGFAVLAERWREKERPVLILLGPAEQNEKGWWGARGLDVCTPSDALSAARMFAASGAYLGNDSGATHLAAAAGAAGVALFGPTEPACWGPRSPRLCAITPQPWAPLQEPAACDTLAAIERALEHAWDGRFLDNPEPRD